MSWIGRELAYVLRSLRRDAAFTSIVIATLALGIGGNSLLLGVVKATFFSRLPFPESDRVLRLLVSYRNPDGSRSTVTVRGREYGVLEKVTAGAAGPFSSVVALENVSETLTGVDAPQKLTVIHCAGDWLGTLGVKPVLGRWFISGEFPDREDSSVAVLDHDLWLNRFGGSSDALGKSLTLDGRVYSVVGVMPAGFRFPYEAEVWTPVTAPYEAMRDYAVFGRLKPGFTTQAVEGALSAAAEVMRKEYAETASGFGFTQISLLQNLQDEQQGVGAALLGVAGFFLLLACANVANLLLARSVVRQREEAIRAALGATAWQRMQRYVMEGVVLSSLGTLAGVGLAALLAPEVDALAPSNFVEQLGIHPNPLDYQVVFVSSLLGLISGILVGLLPAVKSAKISDEWLARASARNGRSRQERRAMRVFVVLQFTLALALLAGAGLMLKNFRRLAHRDLGFDSSRLLSMQVSVSAPRFESAEAKVALVRNILRETESTPGVSAAGVTSMTPLGPGSWWAPVVAAGQEGVFGEASNLVNHRLVSPGFFRSMGIPLLRGRVFTEQDTRTAAPVAIVSERMAKKFWPAAEAVGQRIRVNRAQQPWLTVVGVVGDVQDYLVAGSPRETWYLPYAQFAQTPAAASIYLIMRSNGDPRSIERSVEQAVWRVDPNVALFEISTMDRFYLDSLKQQRLGTWLVGAGAGLGLLLGVLGVYGTLSFSVAARTREIGVRMALGARPRDILWLTIFEGMQLSLFSLVFGVAGALVVGRVLASQLSQVESRDKTTIVMAAVILCGAALIASYLPARHAAEVDPQVALRGE
jgi:putative ABC transport system permease protein